MEERDIQVALGEIAVETDPTLKSQRMASLVSAVFREAGVELVVVGGSAIEVYTEGAYASGDLDLCLVPPSTLTLRPAAGVDGATGGRRRPAQLAGGGWRGCLWMCWGRWSR